MKFESMNEVCIKWQKDLENAILGEIKRKAIEHGIKTEYILNKKAIIFALEKQIPKKPIKTPDNHKWFCPTCYNSIKLGRNHCCNCGQKIGYGSDTE